MSIKHKLVGLALAGALGVAGASIPLPVDPNMAYAADSNTQQSESGQSDQRGYTPVDGEGLKLTLHEGDKVKVSGDTATLVDKDGKEISSIQAEVPEGYTLEFDSSTNILKPVSKMSNASGDRAAKVSCTNNKWAKWFVRGTGDMLVCVPATIGASAVSGPEGIAVAAGCGVGVEGLVTAISCN